MIRLLIFMILSFSCVAGAFEPLKNAKVALFWDYDKAITAEEIALMKLKVMLYLQEHMKVVKESDHVPEWLNEYHRSYNQKNMKALNSDIDPGIDNCIIVHYARKIVYELPGSSQMVIYIPGMGSIDMTDDDPDWCHQSLLSIDIYERNTGKRVYTFISNKESGSMNSYDQEEFNDNIEEIAEDMEERFFKEENWDFFTTPGMMKRDTSYVSTVIKKRLLYLFCKLPVIGESIPVKIGIDEYGTVIDVNLNDSISSAVSNIVRTFFESINFGRNAVPNDTEYIHIKLTQSNFKNVNLINGYYASIHGYRDAEEVWRIMQWHIDQFVSRKSVIMGDRAKEYLHVGFTINKTGNVEGLQFLDGTKYALKGDKKNTRIISGWEFGDKNDDRDYGTKVECIFSLEENKIRVKTR